MENPIDKLKELADSAQTLEGGKYFIIVEDSDGNTASRVVGTTGWVFEGLINLGQQDAKIAAAIKGAAAVL